jgi:hypothetical protein
VEESKESTLSKENDDEGDVIKRISKRETHKRAKAIKPIKE